MISCDDLLDIFPLPKKTSSFSAKLTILPQGNASIRPSALSTRSAVSGVCSSHLAYASKAAKLLLSRPGAPTRQERRFRRATYSSRARNLDIAWNCWGCTWPILKLQWYPNSWVMNPPSTGGTRPHPIVLPLAWRTHRPGAVHALPNEAAQQVQPETILAAQRTIAPPSDAAAARKAWGTSLRVSGWENTEAISCHVYSCFLDDDFIHFVIHNTPAAFAGFFGELIPHRAKLLTARNRPLKASKLEEWSCLCAIFQCLFLYASPVFNGEMKNNWHLDRWRHHIHHSLHCRES